MERQFLKDLGLEDETIGKIMSEHGKTLNSTKDAKDQAERERDNYKQQLTDKDKTLAERDTQLEELSKNANANDDLKQQITDLQKKNDETQKQYEERLKNQKLDFAIERKLGANDAKYPDLLKDKLDTERLQLDGDEIIGFNEQIGKLKESYPDLFKAEEPPGLKGKTPNPGAGDHTTPIDKNPFSKENWNLTEQGRLSQEEPEKYKQLKAQAEAN